MADAPLTGNYPELPEPQGSKMLSFATAGDIPGWILYVKQYARAAIDADRAARSDPPSPPAAEFTTGDADIDALLNETANLQRGPEHNNMDTVLLWQSCLEKILARLKVPKGGA